MPRKPFEPHVWRGWFIDRSFPSGMYSGSNGVRLRADTLTGLKEFIRAYERGEVKNV